MAPLAGLAGSIMYTVTVDWAVALASSSSAMVAESMIRVCFGAFMCLPADFLLLTT